MAMSSEETELELLPPPHAASKAAKSSAEARSIERRKVRFCIGMRRLGRLARGQHSIDQFERPLELVVP